MVYVKSMLFARSVKSQRIVPSFTLPLLEIFETAHAFGYPSTTCKAGFVPLTVMANFTVTGLTRFEVVRHDVTVDNNPVRRKSTNG